MAGLMVHYSVYWLARLSDLPTERLMGHQSVDCLAGHWVAPSAHLWAGPSAPLKDAH